VRSPINPGSTPTEATNRHERRNVHLVNGLPTALRSLAKVVGNGRDPGGRKLEPTEPGQVDLELRVLPRLLVMCWRHRGLIELDATLLAAMRQVVIAPAALQADHDRLRDVLLIRSS
jgi:hypothetical protein